MLIQTPATTSTSAITTEQDYKTCAGIVITELKVRHLYFETNENGDKKYSIRMVDVDMKKSLGDFSCIGQPRMFSRSSSYRS